MTQLVTSDQFITGVLCELTLCGVSLIKLADTLADKQFEDSYKYLIENLGQWDVEPDFSLLTNPHHGDSETLRETLYLIRERGLVSINNPSFKTVEIRLRADEAEEYFARSPLPRTFFSEIVKLYWGEGDNREFAGANRRAT